MATIYSYPRVENLTGDDVLLLSDSTEEQRTLSVSIGQVADYASGFIQLGKNSSAIDFVSEFQDYVSIEDNVLTIGGYATAGDVDTISSGLAELKIETQANLDGTISQLELQVEAEYKSYTDGKLTSYSTSDATQQLVASATADKATSESVTNLSSRIFDPETNTLSQSFANSVMTTESTTDYAAASDVTKLQTDVNNNTAGVSNNTTLISNETSARAAAISTLQTNVNGNAANIASNFTTISNETSARAAAVQTLTTNVAGNTTNISSNATAISDEKSARISAVQTLQTNVNGNTANISNNASTISTETSARAAADQVLTTNVAGNTTNISINATAISNETSARVTAVSELRTDVDGNEASITNNTTAISNEESARITSAESLQAGVDGNTANIEINATAISTETTARVEEASALRTDVDGNASSITTNATAISTETTARTEAISALRTDVDGNEASITTNATTISTETTARVEAISALRTDVDGNAASITTNATAISTETTARVEEASALRTDVDGNAASITTNATAISNEESARVSAIAKLQTDVDGNTASITTNTNLISTETEARAAAVTTLTSGVAGNVASITTNTSTIAGIDGNVSALYTLEVDADSGNVAGMKLGANEEGSEIIFTADSFKVSNGTEGETPFEVVDGQVKIKSANIGSITFGDIADTPEILTTTIIYAADGTGTDASTTKGTLTHVAFYNEAWTDGDSVEGITFDRIAGTNGENGTSGPIGPSGSAGASAYEEWVAAGNEGDVTAFLESLIGQEGPQGSQGIPGERGVNGQTTYTWIRYADSASGASGFSNDPTGKPYIGFAFNKTTATESDDPGDYTWSLIKGADGDSAYASWLSAGNTGSSTDFLNSLIGQEGPQGSQGIPGTQGPDGVTTYTWIRYADSSDGSENFSNDPTDRSYIGFAFNKTTSTESEEESDYIWSLIKGADGAQGEQGAAGVNAKAIKLTPSSHVINYTEAGGETDTITFTTEIQGASAGVTYQFYVNNTPKGPASTTSTFTLPDDLEPASGASVEVEVELKSGSTVLARDSVTIFGVQNGSDAPTAFLTNAAHVVPAAASNISRIFNDRVLADGGIIESLECIESVDGAVLSYTGSGGTFKVFVGNTDVTASCTFKVDSQNAITASINSSGVYTIYNLKANNGFAVLEATIPAATANAASNVILTAEYSISKSITGETGDTGATGGTGATGPAGPTGTNGRKTATGIIFYKSGSADAPSTPSASGVSYNLNSGVFTQLDDDWSTQSPEMAAGTASNKYWTSRFNVVESSPGSGIGTPSFAAPVRAFAFNQVVTFDSLGSGGTTTIDGGRITTGILKSVDYSNTSGNGFSESGMAVNLDNDSIHTPQFSIESDGSANFKGTIELLNSKELYNTATSTVNVDQSILIEPNTGTIKLAFDNMPEEDLSLSYATGYPEEGELILDSLGLSIDAAGMLSPGEIHGFNNNGILVNAKSRKVDPISPPYINWEAGSGQTWITGAYLKATSEASGYQSSQTPTATYGAVIERARLDGVIHHTQEGDASTNSSSPTHISSTHAGYINKRTNSGTSYVKLPNDARKHQVIDVTTLNSNHYTRVYSGCTAGAQNRPGKHGDHRLYDANADKIYYTGWHTYITVDQKQTERFIWMGTYWKRIIWDQ